MFLLSCHQQELLILNPPQKKNSEYSLMAKSSDTTQNRLAIGRRGNQPLRLSYGLTVVSPRNSHGEILAPEVMSLGSMTLGEIIGP